MIGFQFLCFLMFSVGVSGLLPKKWRGPTAGILAFLGALQFLSWRLNSAFIDDRFLMHADWETLTQSGGFFWYEGLFFMLFGTLLWWVIHSLGMGLAGLRKHRIIYSISLFTIGLGLLFLPGGMINTLANTSLFHSVEVVGLDDALEDLGMDAENYVRPEQIQAKAGKNMIVIFMESMEAGFLD
ncbi:MAG: hypothetical protein AAFV80_13945, partial [Bacteroidota bacterium]